MLYCAEQVGEVAMKEAQITLPELALIGGTRVALGAGLGLLLADRLQPAQRKAVGWTLFLVGALSTVPLAIEILGKYRPLDSGGRASWSSDPSEGDALENVSELAILEGG
jgi:hypothetical protein